MKKYYFMAAAALTLVGCTNEYLGENLTEKAQKEITFIGAKPNMTRATELFGADAASKLGYNFKLFGKKIMSDGSKPMVFDNYTVWWDTNDNSTTNKNGWEYVGVSGGQYGSSGNTVTLDKDQTVKYWDNNAQSYLFAAYKNSSEYLTITPDLDNVKLTVAFDNKGEAGIYPSREFAKLYLSNIAIVPHENFNEPVKLTFRSAGTNVTMGFYETIPGYSVKIKQFYQPGTTPSGAITTSDLTEATGNILIHGNFVSPTSVPVISYAADGTVTMNFTGTGAATKSMNFGPVSAVLPNTIGTSAAEATKPYTVQVFPHDATIRPEDIVLKMDYELIAQDAYTQNNVTTHETIEVKGATVVVPKEFCEWKQNYAYTYIFKITDSKLNPIVFDASFVQEIDGSSEVITTVDEPAISTYAHNSNVLTDNEYVAGNIYVAVESAGYNMDLTEDNSTLYRAFVEAGALQEVTNATVANTLARGKMYKVSDTSSWVAGTTDVANVYKIDNGKIVHCANGEKYNAGVTYCNEAAANEATIWVSTDAAGKQIVITAVGSSDTDKLTALTSIPAAYSPTGADLAVKCAMFVASPATTYVYKYTKAANDCYYKVIKVKAAQ